MNKLQETGKIVIFYALLGSTWIYFSDTALDWLVRDPEIITKIAIFKGLLFILCTSLLLFFLIARLTDKIKQSTTALLASEERLRFLVKNSSDILVIVNADGSLRYVSPAAERITGFPTAELEGRALDTLIHPNDRKDIMTAWNEAVEHPEKTVTVQYRHIHKTREWVFSEAIAQSFLGEPAINGVIASVRDITERKRAEMTLLESEKLYRSLFENMMNGFAYCRMLFENGKPQDFIYLAVNDAFERQTGLKDVVGRKVTEVIPGIRDKDLELFEIYGRVAMTQEPTRFEMFVEALQMWFSISVYSPAHEHFVAVFDVITERKQAEALLSASEEKFRTVANHILNWEYWRATEGNLIYVSPSCERITSYKAEEFLQDPELLIRIIHPDDRKIFVQHVVDIAKGITRKDYQALDFRILTRSGDERWISHVCREVFSQEGKSIGRRVCNQDITERKKAEKALSKSEAHYHSLFDNSLIGVTVTDRSFIITDANDAFCKMLEYSREELVGKMTISDVSHPDDVLSSMDLVNKLIRNDIDHFSLEKDYVSKTGKSIPTLIYVRGHYNPDGEYEGTTASILDITERKKADDLLRESNEKFIVAFKNAPIIIAISNLEDGTYLDINQRFIDVFGFSREEVIGKSSIELGLITESHRQQLLEVINMKGKIEDVDLVMSTKSGQELLFKYWGEIIMISNQNRLLSISLDVTEHRKIEHQLQQAQKMDSVGRLAGGVAHDFNNMLGVILGHAEMAMDQLDPAQPLFADLDEIRKAASRSADLTRQLLAFARKQTVAPKVLDLNETIEGFLKMLRRLIGEDIDLVWMPGAGLWPVKVDPSQLDQILANLCVNARDSIAGVGKIIIETGNGTFDEEFCATHAGCVSGEYVRISVSDTGSGMDKGTLSHIFEPFFTTKGIGEGTGLGLSTVYGAVKQNNGYIDVYSEPGQGTIFTINLPRYKEVDTTGRTFKEGAAEPVVGGHETILIVEDEPTILKMTTTILQRLGYTVIAASSPGEAIRIVEEFVAELHLLITDVIMPEMNGRDLADRLMTIKKGLKCLFMSGYTSDIIANQGVLVEGMHFIQKPFSQKELAARIRKVLNTEEEKVH